MKSSPPFLLFALRCAPAFLLAAVVLGFGLAAPKFLEVQNGVNILVQSSSTAITAVGMTLVLLTAGIDLSVGSVMFVSAAVAGKIALAGGPVFLSFVTVVAVGLVYGGINALFVARLRVMPFIATLATLYMGRGLGLWITETRAMNLPEDILRIGTGKVLGVPVPVLVCAAVVAAAHLTLTRTAFGRHVYAVGQDPEAAQKAGIPVRRILTWVYVLCGGCAAVGGLVSLAQLGAVSPTFGKQREFAAVAAAVLGGTSLFGGRGSAFPGTVLGAVLIQTVENGLVLVHADPYDYPLVTGGIIFLAVGLDGVRHGFVDRIARRRIRGT